MKGSQGQSIAVIIVRILSLPILLVGVVVWCAAFACSAVFQGVRGLFGRLTRLWRAPQPEPRPPASSDDPSTAEAEILRS